MESPLGAGAKSSGNPVHKVVEKSYVAFCNNTVLDADVTQIERLFMTTVMTFKRASSIFVIHVMFVTGS